MVEIKMKTMFKKEEAVKKCAPRGRVVENAVSYLHEVLPRWFMSRWTTYMKQSIFAACMWSAGFPEAHLPDLNGMNCRKQYF